MESKPNNHRKKWTKDDLSKLFENYKSGTNIQSLALQFQRTDGSIICQLRQQFKLEIDEGETIEFIAIKYNKKRIDIEKILERLSKSEIHQNNNKEYSSFFS